MSRNPSTMSPTAVKFGFHALVKVNNESTPELQAALELTLVVDLVVRTEWVMIWTLTA